MKRIKINIDVKNPETALRISKLFKGAKIDSATISAFLSRGSNNPKSGKARG